jgi:hypothetical protein
MNSSLRRVRIRPAGAVALACGVASGLLGAAALIAVLLAPLMCQTAGAGAGAATRVVATTGDASQPPSEVLITASSSGPVVTCHALGAVGVSAAMAAVLVLMGVALAVIVAGVCARVLLRRRMALLLLWPAALALLALSYLTGFSIGAYLLPSALLGLIAAIAATR